MGAIAVLTVLWAGGLCLPALGSIVELVHEPLWSEDPDAPGPQWGMEQAVFGLNEFPDGKQPYVHLDGAR